MYIVDLMIIKIQFKNKCIILVFNLLYTNLNLNSGFIWYNGINNSIILIKYT
jgi:hypothetical protein